MIRTCSGNSLSKVGCSMIARMLSLTTEFNAEVNRLAAFEKISLFVRCFSRTGRASGWYRTTSRWAK